MTTTQFDSHDDVHAQNHHHPHGPETLPQPSEAGSVVLDIGPGAGAAVIVTSAAMNGREIEYRASGDAWEEKHMAVRERRGPGLVQHAAIFGPLPPGLYEFRERGSKSPTATLLVNVQGGMVANGAWPTPD
jgi:hypothetical protein